MKPLFFIVIYLLANFGCSTKDSLDVSYFKVLSLGRADSTTRYNKGISLFTYAYYEPATDSMIYRDVKGINPGRFETYVGKLESDGFLDTIRLTIDALRKYKNGIIFDTIYDGSTYCGPELYIEFKDSRGIHYYDIIMGSNDTLDQFCRFFSRFINMSWKKQPVENNLINADREAVSALSRLGLYEKRETPYIPLPCEPGIDFDKISGTWRSIGSKYDRSSASNYQKLTILKDGTCFSQKVVNGVESEPIRSKTKWNRKEKTFFSIDKGKPLHKYIVLKLTENCFEYKLVDEDYVIRWDRL